MRADYEPDPCSLCGWLHREANCPYNSDEDKYRREGSLQRAIRAIEDQRRQREVQR